MNHKITIELSEQQLGHIKLHIKKHLESDWEEESQSSFSLNIEFWELGPTLQFNGYNTVDIGYVEVTV
jgi:hypothetical protein